MADGDIEEEASGTPPPPDPNAGAGDAGGGAPPGGGPILASIARSQQGPQQSAPGPGDNAGAMGKLLQAIKLIQQAQAGLPPGSPLHKDVVNAVSRLSRHLPQGAPTVGVQKTGMMDLLRQIGQSGFLQNIMQQMGGGTGGGQPQAPNPSMPLPGA
jgi:hypothetical protein